MHPELPGQREDRSPQGCQFQGGCDRPAAVPAVLRDVAEDPEQRPATGDAARGERRSGSRAGRTAIHRCLLEEGDPPRGGEPGNLRLHEGHQVFVLCVGGDEQVPGHPGQRGLFWAPRPDSRHIPVADEQSTGCVQGGGGDVRRDLPPRSGEARAPHPAHPADDAGGRGRPQLWRSERSYRSARTGRLGRVVQPRVYREEHVQGHQAADDGPVGPHQAAVPGAVRPQGREHVGQDGRPRSPVARRERLCRLQGHPRVRDARHPRLPAAHVVPCPARPLRAARVVHAFFRFRHPQEKECPPTAADLRRDAVEAPPAQQHARGADRR